MKKLFLIFSLLALFTTNAQSDATKEETVKWLENYGGNLLLQENDEYYSYLIVSSKTEIMSVRSLKKDERPYDYTINFSKIKEVKLYETNNFGIIRINAKGKEDFERYYFKGTGDEKLDYAFLRFQEIEGAKRVFKALKHLFSFYDYDIKYDDATEVENKF